MIKLADTLKAMSDFPVALADSIEFSDGANLQEKFDNKELGGGDSSVTLTQEEYEALTEEEKLDGLYYTYDTKRIYKNGVQYGASEPIPLTMEEYKTLKEAGAIDEQQEYLVEADAEGIFLGAEDIGYNNAESGLEATTVQGAIDKVVEKVNNKTEIDDTVTGDTNTWSSSKINNTKADKQFNIKNIDYLKSDRPYLKISRNGNLRPVSYYTCDTYILCNHNGDMGALSFIYNDNGASCVYKNIVGTLPLSVEKYNEYTCWLKYSSTESEIYTVYALNGYKPTVLAVTSTT